MINLVWKFFENFQNFLKNFQKKFQKFFGNFGEAVDFFADRFENFSTRGGAKAGSAGRSGQMLHVAYLVAKFGLYPDENEPRQDCKFPSKFAEISAKLSTSSPTVCKIFRPGAVQKLGERVALGKGYT